MPGRAHYNIRPFPPNLESDEINWPLLAPDGTWAAPSYSFNDETYTGFHRISSGLIGIGGGNGFVVHAEGPSSTSYTGLHVDGGNAISEVVTTGLGIYAGNAPALRVGTGSGLNNHILFRVGGADYWEMSSSAGAPFIPTVTNSYDIGADSRLVRSVYVGTKVISPEIEHATKITLDAPDVDIANDLTYLNTFFEDLRVSLISAKVGAATWQPDWAQIATDGAGSRGVYGWLFSAASPNEVFFETQLPHAWKEGTTIHPHIHWAPDGTDTGDVEWNLEYTLASVDGTFGNTATLTNTDAGDGTAYKHQICDMGDIDMSGKTLSTVLICRLWRTATGNDDLTDGAFGLSVDFHYEIDTPGSEEEYTKS